MKSATITVDSDLGTGWWAKRQRELIGKVLAPLSRASKGVLSLTLPNGSSLQFGEHPCERLNPSIVLHNWKVLRKAFAGGSVGWAEAYMDGDWDSPDMATVVEWVAFNEKDFGGVLDSGKTQSLMQKWRHRRNANSKRGSRRNIAYHYDLGNEFYRHWLDDSMTYSSAFYGSDAQNLGDAQAAKYQRIIDMLGIKDGDRVLEIGCGWGGFAEQLCRQFDVRLEGITLSEQQLAFARQRIADAGLSERASFSLTDYRDTREQYDHIVSIEMLEAVGEKYWPTYFETVKARLKPGGSASIQIITIEEARFSGYRDNPDFIQTYIFPGGMLPSPERFRAQAEQIGLTVKDELAFGLDYANTLAEWDRRFDEQWEAIAPLGFDERFKRMWHYYLAYCEGGFRANSIDVYQYLLEKPAA